jgi:hypothetical protein
VPPRGIPLEIDGDTQSVVPDSKDQFEVCGLGAERYSLTSVVNGYHLSSKYHSVNSENSYRLIGTIDLDITILEILLEPGDARAW